MREFRIELDATVYFSVKAGTEAQARAKARALRNRYLVNGHGIHLPEDEGPDPPTMNVFVDENVSPQIVDIEV